MADTTYSFFGATAVVDCHVELDGQATAAFAVEVINANFGNFGLSKLEANVDHAAKHHFRVNGPDSSATILLKIVCTTSPPDGADVFVLASQTTTKLACMDGTGTLVPQTARGVNVGTVVAGKTGIFFLRVIK